MRAPSPGMGSRWSRSTSSDGGGALGTYTVMNRRPARDVGERRRGIDQDNGSGNIDSTEASTLLRQHADSDGLRQTTIDLMQLVKVLKGGVDVDGDGGDDLSSSRIYYQASRS